MSIEVNVPESCGCCDCRTGSRAVCTGSWSFRDRSSSRTKLIDQTSWRGWRWAKCKSIAWPLIIIIPLKKIFYSRLKLICTRGWEIRWMVHSWIVFVQINAGLKSRIVSLIWTWWWKIVGRWLESVIVALEDRRRLSKGWKRVRSRLVECVRSRWREVNRGWEARLNTLRQIILLTWKNKSNI